MTILRHKLFFLLAGTALGALFAAHEIAYRGGEVTESFPSLGASSTSIVRLERDGTSTYLVTALGMSLYQYERDSTTTSLCYDFCAVLRPPLVVAAGETIDPAIPGRFGTLWRTDRNIQMIYEGKPVYLYMGDEKPGERKGGNEKFWHEIRMELL